jgi:hypothetical protein
MSNLVLPNECIEFPKRKYISHVENQFPVFIDVVIKIYVQARIINKNVYRLNVCLGKKGTFEIHYLR